MRASQHLQNTSNLTLCFSLSCIVLKYEMLEKRRLFRRVCETDKDWISMKGNIKIVLR